MSENNYPEGSLEWHAWGRGNDYARTHGNDRDEPLDGQWADGPIPHRIIAEVWQDVLGASWDTYDEDNDEDRDADTDILDAWESGYRGDDED